MFRQRYSTSVWDEMDRLQREMNRLFEDFDHGMKPLSGFPAMNVWMNEDGAVATAELPGVDVGDLDIRVVGQTLTLSGERKVENLPKEAVFHRRERSKGKFSRTLDLPFMVDSEKVQATLEKGILRILLPRAEQDKPRRISIKTAS